MIRITSKQDGFRRCGVAHPKEPVEYADTEFTKKELEILQSEPMLIVQMGQDGDNSNKGEKVKAPLAADLIAQIAVAETSEAVDAILGEDKRATVVAAAEARKAELAKAKE